jgi:hypothetical protein
MDIAGVKYIAMPKRLFADCLMAAHSLDRAQSANILEGCRPSPGEGMVRQDSLHEPKGERGATLQTRRLRRDAGPPSLITRVKEITMSGKNLAIVNELESAVEGVLVEVRDVAAAALREIERLVQGRQPDADVGPPVTDPSPVGPARVKPKPVPGGDPL